MDPSITVRLLRFLRLQNHRRITPNNLMRMWLATREHKYFSRTHRSSTKNEPRETFLLASVSSKRRRTFTIGNIWMSSQGFIDFDTKYNICQISRRFRNNEDDDELDVFLVLRNSRPRKWLKAFAFYVVWAKLSRLHTLSSLENVKDFHMKFTVELHTRI